MGIRQGQSFQERKIVLTNANIFDGKGGFALGTVVIEDGKIGQDPTGAVEVDMQHGFLLPGLIDGHVHVQGLESLSELSKYGVTTALDMGTATLEVFGSGSLRGVPGVADIRSPGIPATSPGSRHSKIPGYPKDALIADASAARHYVGARINEGADYIKIMVDNPGPDQSTVNSVVAEAHKHGKLTIAHVGTFEMTKLALRAGIDVVTHVPMDKVIDADALTMLQMEGHVVVPTLVKMQGTAVKDPVKNDFTVAHASVVAVHQAGVPIVAGSDANGKNSGPAKVEYGLGLHRELELLVDAGLSTAEAIRAATSVPAQYFGLHDRGSIEIGKRADLVLLSDNPIENIRATKSIQRVFCGGVEYGSHETHEGGSDESFVKRHDVSKTSPDHRQPSVDELVVELIERFLRIGKGVNKMFWAAFGWCVRW